MKSSEALHAVWKHVRPKVGPFETLDLTEHRDEMRGDLVVQAHYHRLHARTYRVLDERHAQVTFTEREVVTTCGSRGALVDLIANRLKYLATLVIPSGRPKEWRLFNRRVPRPSRWSRLRTRLE